MHSYLRSIGFSNINNNKQWNEFLLKVINNPIPYKIIEEKGDYKKVLYINSYASSLGVNVVAEHYGEDIEICYYYPFCRSQSISQEKLEVQKQSRDGSYAGICDDYRLGVTLIFYLKNYFSYLEKMKDKKENMEFKVAFTGMSIEGKVLLPVEEKEKNESYGEFVNRDSNSSYAFSQENKEEIIDKLTLEDLDLYPILASRVQYEDLLSIIQTTFMPYGSESDQYEILGTILDVRIEINGITKEKIYILKVEANDFLMDVCINAMDLIGEPDIGRRFKGVIWMQGTIVD